MASSLDRQMWIEKAVKGFRGHFYSSGFAVPDNVRISVGIPKGIHGRGKAIGQCWSNANSSDNYYEMFVSPELGGETNILETIGHELCHATVGTKEGHRGQFKACALAVGFKAPMTQTPSEEKMAHFIKNLMNSIGHYPAGSLDISGRKKKQTYMLKCQCPDCGYTVRTTQQWLAIGYPICPVDEVEMK